MYTAPILNWSQASALVRVTRFAGGNRHLIGRNKTLISATLALHRGWDPTDGQPRAAPCSSPTGRTRSLFLQQIGSAIPTAFLVVLVLWLAVIITSFGLFAPYNGTVIATLSLCTLSV